MATVEHSIPTGKYLPTGEIFVWFTCEYNYGALGCFTDRISSVLLCFSTSSHVGVRGRFPWLPFVRRASTGLKKARRSGAYTPAPIKLYVLHNQSQTNPNLLFFATSGWRQPEINGNFVFRYWMAHFGSKKDTTDAWWKSVDLRC